jgi:negative regulator of flagellin synthesis FlgM
MAIEGLGPVDPISNYGKTQKVDANRQRPAPDSVDVTEEARRKAEIYQITQEVQSAPDIRTDRVEEVRRRLEDPAYVDSVLDDVADRIIDAFGV